MALVSGVTMKVLLNEFDMSSYFRAITPSFARDMYDTTTFGATQKNVIPGFTAGTIEIEGLHEETGTASAPDNVFASIEGATTVPLVTVAPEGLALGKRLYLLQAHEATHGVAAKIDDLVLNRATFQSNDGFDCGASLHDLTAETVFPFSGAAYPTVPDGVASTNGGVGFLHVTAIAGAAPNLTFKIQHSVDGSTLWGDLVTFTAVTTATSERVAVAPLTAIRQYLRASVTNAGTTTSCTFVVGFARR